MKRPSSLAALLRSVGVVVLLTSSLGVLVAAVAVPRLAGASTYTVLTSSMVPDLPPGTLVVVRPDEHVGVGSVITYQLHSGEPAVVTHRVVGVGIDGGGHRSFVTRGDANQLPDSAPVRAEQVRGSVWYALPYVGYVDQVLSGWQRRLLGTSVAAALVVYALVMFLPRRGEARRHVRA